MSFVASLVLAVGVAMDAFAVSLGVGTAGKANDRRSKFRLSFHFGFFQSAMTLLGWLLGSTVANLIHSFAGWVALALLGYVGFGMIRSGRNTECESWKGEPSKGRTLMMLCVATSLDAMAVGVGMGVLKTQVVSPILLIGLVTGGLSIIGLEAGRQLSNTFGKRMEILGGLILVGIGLNMALGSIL